MKLSEKEKSILSHCLTDAKKTNDELATLTGYKSHTVHYSLHKLKEQGIIHPVSLINLSPFGYTEYAVYFSLKTENTHIRTQVLNTFLDSENVPWAIELGGEYQYALAYRATNILDVIDMFDSITEQFGNVFFNKSIHIRIFVTLYSRKYFNTKAKSKALTIHQTKNTVHYDNLDIKILRLVEMDGSLSSYDLEKKLSVSASTIKSRLKKLEEHSVIVGHTYAFNHLKAGTHLYDLLIFTNTFDKKFVDKMKKFSEEEPNIIHFLQGVGEWDFEIGIDLEKSEDVTLITQKLYTEFGTEIISIKVLPIFRHLKFSLCTF
ncbi:MAG: hypothetical protein COV59_00395 [Candidatus Magasanikbacteria bacterium CG11_big_fil_rev_8_21_14_0_20_39_34]|uniref:HTH asnC-type domain-containing protein n=1 Tax=Candidatus Magasanikbacteria bacterium CG11_big_fil_rev_8_21_14_0_20_39_34 TaxID=1974653 RepID=A0A2H0N6Q4_9BACT|nr:MAG: hypothetical protein COV59_00395 [Candidatus Magasanikbacteria bacterium CG11_big_fil_rev_8_21_14_0_20_39_34]